MGGDTSSPPLLIPPSARGLGVALKTPLCVGLSLGLELEKGPSPEPLPVPVLNRPQVPLGDPAQGSCSPSPHSPCEVSIGVYFLLEMSLLGMNVDWFVLKLVNC